MCIEKIVRMLVAIFLIVAAPHSSATPTLLVNSNGILTGAKNIDVAGKLYDVMFAEGSCNSLFGGCSSSNFGFNKRQDAFNAALSLINQVFIDGPAGQFDSHPELIFGCSSVEYCVTYTVYSYLAPNAQIVAAGNMGAWADWNTANDVAPSAMSDTTNSVFHNYAIFALSSNATDLPEPNSIALTTLAIAALALTRRRRR